MVDREIRWGCEQPLLVKSMELIAIKCSYCICERSIERSRWSMRIPWALRWFLVLHSTCPGSTTNCQKSQKGQSSSSSYSRTTPHFVPLLASASHQIMCFASGFRSRSREIGCIIGNMSTSAVYSLPQNPLDDQCALHRQ